MIQSRVHLFPHARLNKRQNSILVSSYYHFVQSMVVVARGFIVQEVSLCYIVILNKEYRFDPYNSGILPLPFFVFSLRLVCPNHYYK